MTKELYISSSPHETKVAVSEDNQLVEVYFQRDTDVGMVGGIYKGRVRRVLPGMQSAFVDIGLERDAFLYVSDFTEDSEEFDKVYAEAETRSARILSGGGTPSPLVPAGPPPAMDEDAERAAGKEPAASPVLTESGATAGRYSPEESSAATTFSPAQNAFPSEPEPGGEAPLATDAATAPSEASGGAQPSSEQPQIRRFDLHGGRRRRRRGGRFGDRSGRGRDQRDREHSAVPPASAGPSAFELLPGESLAKYSQALPGEGTTDAAESTTANGGASIQPGEALASPAASVDVAAGAAPAPEPLTRPPDEAIAAPGSADSARSGVAASKPASAVQEMGPQALEAGGGARIVTVPLPEEKEPKAGASFHFSAAAAQVPKPLEEGTSPVVTGAGPGDEDSSGAGQETAEAGAGEDYQAEEGQESDGSEYEVSQASVPGGEGEFALEEGASEVAAVAGEQEAGGTAEAGEEPGERSYTLRESSQRPRFAPRRGRRGRQFGRRGPGGFRREGSRPGNLAPVQINEVLKEGQEILVQIAKEPLGTKGARITSHVALPGRHLVYMPTISHIGVSRKIASEEERYRLRNIIIENRGSLTGGFIVRTAAAGCAEEELKADLKFLSTLWNEIRAKAEAAKAPALIHRDLTLVQRLLRDILNPDFKTVRVDSEIEYENAVEFVSRCQPSLVGHVKLHTRPTPLFEEFGIQAEIDKALRPKVWLKSGGYIVINQTEALVAIDVNTGKFVGKTNRLEDTIVKTNVDAVLEIVRQIRLRDLGGIIVIDFIDMDDRRNRFKVVQALEEALRADRAPTKILSFNEFGLVALTRKRVKQSLERTLCEPCPYCSGGGWVKSVDSVCYEIVAEARKMAEQVDGNRMTLRVHPDVAKALKSRHGALISELEVNTRKDVIIKGDPVVHQERFEIF